MDVTTITDVFAKEWQNKWFALMPDDLKPVAHKIQCLTIYAKNDFDMKNVNPDYVFAKYHNNSMLASFIEHDGIIFENIRWYVIITSDDDYICYLQDDLRLTGCADIVGIPDMWAMTKSEPHWHLNRYMLGVWNLAKSNPHIYANCQQIYVEHNTCCLLIASIHEFYTSPENIDAWQTWTTLERILHDEHLVKQIAKN